MSIPINPFSTMPTARPDLFPGLFTSRPDNNVNIPKYAIPGLYATTARKAIGVVALLSNVGVSCTVPFFYPDDSLTTRIADEADPVAREYFTRPVVSSASDALAINSFSVMQIAIRLGGMNESPTAGLADILDDMRVPHASIQIRPTDQEIVDALKKIFG